MAGTAGASDNGGATMSYIILGMVIGIILMVAAYFHYRLNEVRDSKRGKKYRMLFNRDESEAA